MTNSRVTMEGKMSLVVLLASHCGDDNPKCSEHSPCAECLAMCNVFEIKKHSPHQTFGPDAQYIAQLGDLQR